MIDHEQISKMSDLKQKFIEILVYVCKERMEMGYDKSPAGFYQDYMRRMKEQFLWNFENESEEENEKTV